MSKLTVDNESNRLGRFLSTSSMAYASPCRMGEDPWSRAIRIRLGTTMQRNGRARYFVSQDPDKSLHQSDDANGNVES